MSVYAPALTSLWLQLQDNDIDPDALFRRHGLSRSDLANPNARASVQRIDALMADAAEQSGDPCFCAREADYLTPSQLGAFSFAWLASVNLRNALTRLERFTLAINSKYESALEEGRDDLLFTGKLDFASVNHWNWDSSLVTSLVRICRMKAGDRWTPAGVHLPHPRPSNDSYLVDMLGCDIQYDADRTAVRFDRADAERTIPGTDAHLAQLNDHIVVKYLAHLEREDIVNRVKAVIIDHLGDGDATEAVVADELHMSTRNLHRRLSQEGTTFKAVLLDTRQELARQYINDSTLTLTEISYLLGFAEASSFSRAYRKWNGHSPSEARKQAAAG